MPRLYVGLLIVLIGLTAIGAHDLAEAGASATEWSSQITPLVRRPEAEIRPLHLSYDVSWSRWLRAGRLDLAFEPRPGAPETVIEASAKARSLGSVRMFWPYASTTRAELSVRTLYPVRVEHIQTERSRHATYRAIYHGGSTTVESEFRPRAGQDVERETHTHADAQIRDVLSMLLFLQQSDLTDRKNLTLLIQPLDRLYLVSFRRIGQERRQVFEKTWSTFKFAIRIQRVTDERELADYTKLHGATLWISDDADQIPVEIQADLQVGFVSVRLRGRE